jgi:hypothetical protein
MTSTLNVSKIEPLSGSGTLHIGSDASNTVSFHTANQHTTLHGNLTVTGNVNFSNTVNFVGAQTGAGVPAGTNIKEELVMLCDGQDYTVSSGTYTSYQVTGEQNISVTETTANGSVISYTPPSGTTLVTYVFQFHHSFVDTFAVTHYRFYIDGTEVPYQATTTSISSGDINQYKKIIIPIGGVANTSTGRQASWTTAKEMKLTVTALGTGNEGKIHNGRYTVGGASTGWTLAIPSLIITSYG